MRRRQTLRLAVALFALAVVATPSAAASFSCPPATITNGLEACHHIQGECNMALYLCDSGYFWWDVCEFC